MTDEDIPVLRHGGDHATHRRAAYAREVPIGDQLDVIWRLVAQIAPLIGGEDAALRDDARAMLDTIAAIKLRHPKGLSDA